MVPHWINEICPLAYLLQKFLHNITVTLYKLYIYICVCVRVFLQKTIYIYIYIYDSYMMSFLCVYLSTWQICLSVYRSIHLSTYRSINLSTYPSTYLSTYLPIYPSVYLSDLSELSVYLSIDGSIYLSIYLSICLSIYPPILPSYLSFLSYPSYPNPVLSYPILTHPILSTYLSHLFLHLSIWYGFWCADLFTYVRLCGNKPTHTHNVYYICNMPYNMPVYFTDKWTLLIS